MKTYRYVLFRIYTNKQNKIIFNCDKKSRFEFMGILILMDRKPVIVPCKKYLVALKRAIWI